MAVHGVVLVDKPAGMTSQQVVSRVRRLYGVRKAGHTGTLDPFATGLLPVCLGEATKASAFMLEADKRYHAVLRLGIQTDTGDCEGRTVAVAPVPVLNEARVDAVLAQFLGEIEQRPPRYSALKKDGRPLYDYARRGITVEAPLRRVRILALRRCWLSSETLAFEVHCSKGTYIRTLGEDIARALGTVGHLEALRRLEIGPLSVDQAYTLTALETAGTDAVLPIETLLQHLPSCHATAGQARRFRHGNPITCGALDAEGMLWRVRDEVGRLLGIGEVRDGQLWPKRLFHL